MPLGPILTPITADLVRGALELETTERGVRPHRLPAWARAQCPDPQLLMAEAQPSGVRLAFRTESTQVELDVVATKRVYAGMPPRPDGSYDLVVDGRLPSRATAPAGDVLTIDLAIGSFDTAPGPVGTVRFEPLSPGAKDVVLWLPHDEAVELVALRTDAPVQPVPGAGRVWLHHGSSISQGSDATEPTGTWPAVAAVRAGVDLVNLGYSGSALVDQFVARTIRDTAADVISLKLGINVVNTDVMRRRAFEAAVHGFLDTVRDGHPTTPLLLVSPLWCGMHEDTPGPSAPDPAAFAAGRAGWVAAGDPAEVPFGKLSLGAIRDELASIVAQRADPHLTYLDGRELYGGADADELPLPDALHPDAAGHRRIGDRFADKALAPGGPLGP